MRKGVWDGGCGILLRSALRCAALLRLLSLSVYLPLIFWLPMVLRTGLLCLLRLLLVYRRHIPFTKLHIWFCIDSLALSFDRVV
jgi:hypothetical protein